MTTIAPEIEDVNLAALEPALPCEIPGGCDREAEWVWTFKHVGCMTVLLSCDYHHHPNVEWWKSVRNRMTANAECTRCGYKGVVGDFTVTWERL